MLTLLLVLGAVTCSPVPSDLPALHDNAHIEVTHEVRHVTYEVSEEVNEATASSHIPSDVPPEEDPPIPTVTTPHTAPEEQHPQEDDNIAEEEVPHESEGEKSQETPPEIEVTHGEEANIEETEIEVTQEEINEPVIEEKESDNENNNEGEKSSVEGSELLSESHVSLPSESESSQQEDSVQTTEETDPTDEAPLEEVDSASVSLEQLEDEENVDLREPQPTIPVELEPTILVESDPTIPAETEHVDPVVVEPTDPAELEPTDPAELEPTSQVETEPTSKSEIEEVVEPEVPLEDEHPSLEEAEPTMPVEEAANIAENNPVDDSEINDSDVNVSDDHDDHHVSTGELFEEVPSQDSQEAADGSEFVETEKRTDDVDLPVNEETPQESSDEVSDVSAPEVENTRESRVYNEYEESSQQESSNIEHVPELHENHNENDSKPVNSGLESLSMTSPTPESLPDDVLDVDELEKEESPSEEYLEYSEEAVLPDIPELDSQEDNSTLATDVEEPDVVPEVFINPPSSSIAPSPGDEFTDNYSDPLEESGNLPDFDVTHEQLPSKTYPLPEETQLIPDNTHDHVGVLSEGDSSDLAAGDHTLEVDSGIPRVLLPQQEQISAAAPSSLTPGCIVAIVFGVLISLVVILGVGGFMIWQRRTQNRPKVLGSDQGYAGSDSGGYIDDQVRVSYVNSQTDTPKGQTSQQPQGQGQQVFIRLKNLKPSLPASAAGMMKSLPTMPKIAPMNLPNLNQIITKRESGGSNQPGQ